MKLIDAYILKSFLVPLFYCLMGFILVYIIYDLFEHLNDFLEAKTPLGLVIKFYLLLMPSVLIFIVPVSLLLSVLYSLSQLTRYNELTAMRASGVSIYRLMIPFIFTGLFASLIVGVVHETLGPWSMYWTEQLLRYEKHKDDRHIEIYIIHNRAYRFVEERRDWWVGSFDTRTFDMKDVQVTQQREDGSDLIKISAKEARLLDGRWWFFEVNTQHYDQDSNPMGPPQFVKRKEMPEITERPDNFLNEIKDPEFLSSRALYHYIKTHQHLSNDIIARFKVDFHHRMAMPWTCFVVTLIGIPFGSQTGRKGALLGVLLCLSLFFSYYVLVNLGLALGKKQTLEPWLAAWGPNILLFIITPPLIFRMR